MKMDENHLERIDAYLDGKMSQSDHTAFEKELEENAALAKEVKMQQAVRKALQEKGKQDLKQELNNYYNQHKNQQTRRKTLRILVPVFSAAASILLLIYIFSDSIKQPDPADQFITLDSAGINQPSEYADSAIYEDSIQKINSDTLKMK